MDAETDKRSQTSKRFVKIQNNIVITDFLIIFLLNSKMGLFVFVSE